MHLFGQLTQHFSSGGLHFGGLRPNFHANRHASFNGDSFALSQNLDFQRHLASAVASVVSAIELHLSMSFSLWILAALNRTVINKMHIFALFLFFVLFSKPSTPLYLVYMSVLAKSQETPAHSSILFAS